MFNVIRQGVRHYYNQIPSNTCMTVGKSAIFSFTATWLLQKISKEVVTGFRRPFAAMCLAGLAALIHALATPFFNAIFGNNEQVRLHQELIKYFCEVILIRLSLGYAVANKVNSLSLTTFSFISVNLIKSVCHFFPNLISWVDPLGASQIKEVLNDVGLDTPDGQNTTFIVI